MTNPVMAIIDDNVAILDAIKFVLEIKGYTVLAYDSAAAFLGDEAASPACLVIDQNMPGMKGLDLVARLRREGNEIPVLLTTGLLTSDILAAAAELEVETVLEKPVEPGALLTFVSQHG
jgi:FixJ family two-component response regulator